MNAFLKLIQQLSSSASNKQRNQRKINIKLYMPPWTNNQLPVQNDSLANYQPVLLNPITSL